MKYSVDENKFNDINSCQSKSLKKNIYTSTEDFKIFMMLTWLELYLPRYELKFGVFKYSSEGLDDRGKINELLEYYAKCGAADIEHIRKNSFKTVRH